MKIIIYCLLHCRNMLHTSYIILYYTVWLVFRFETLCATAYISLPAIDYRMCEMAWAAIRCFLANSRYFSAVLLQTCYVSILSVSGMAYWKCNWCNLFSKRSHSTQTGSQKTVSAVIDEPVVPTRTLTDSERLYLSKYVFE